jgi:hypothetical protein
MFICTSTYITLLKYDLIYIHVYVAVVLNNLVAIVTAPVSNFVMS